MKTIKIHGLPPGWCDKDHLILHAAFQLLVDFVREEKPDRVVDWDATPASKHAWKEIRSLYEWWMQVRPSRRSPLKNKALKRPPMRWRKVASSGCRELVFADEKKYPAYHKALNEHSRLETKWEREDQQNLHRLVEIRQYLWT